MMVNFFDELDLQRKIAKILNRQGFHFEKTKSPEFCDLIDPVNKIYVEVKADKFAPAQLIYGLVRNDIKDAKYLALASAYEIRFYKAPSFRLMEEFARKIDPELKRSPSSINEQRLNEQAFRLLGGHHVIYTYSGTFTLDEPQKIIFVDENNYAYFKLLFDKYNINPAQFLTFIAKIYAENNEIRINRKGQIYESNNLTMYRNQQNGYHDKKRQYTFNGNVIHDERDIRPIKDPRDKELFESIRVKAEDVEKILHRIDLMTPLKIRRQIGKFFSGENIGKYLCNIIMELIGPDLIIEPMVGGGSLIAPFIERGVHCIINDINKGHIDLLEKKYEGRILGAFWDDFIKKPINEIIRDWQIPATSDKKLLIYTNPPFGTVSTNKLVSKKSENSNKKKSRKIKIEYGSLAAIYGKGDLVIPSVGKMIEIVKKLNFGYIAFFSPFGVFCNRKRYNKLLKALLKDFKFIYGEVFSGKHFHGVSGRKPISFSIWKFSPNIDLMHEKIVFCFEENVLKFRKSFLLKDGWKYDTRKKIRGEIVIQGNDRFNAPTPKMFHLNASKGGSEVISENIKIDLQIANIPSELFYALWSACVGYRAIADYPVYFDNANTHLPDLTKKETFEILAYVIIHVLITEMLHGYTEGRIGFEGMMREFRFGNKRLTEGCLYILNEFGRNCKLGSKTILEVFEELKRTVNPEKINKEYRQMIKKEIEIRLEKIGYWDFIPI